ncbi:MAG: CPBP family intramembrane metalloprotease [Bacilli bacterium]|nr:CPBP family intramembrane metalloprotease [Bacilli bacterium]
MGKKVITLIVSLVVICLITFGAGFLGLFITDSLILFIAKFFVYYLIGAVALVAIKLTGVEIGLDFRNWKSYLIGLVMAIALSLFIAVIPALFGSSIVGSHLDPTPDILISNFLFFFLAVGPVEELVFRVYVQETFISFFKSHKWIAVIIAAFLFGLWHIINGSLLQVLFTFGIGLVFGFAKYFLKDCKFLGVATAHGLYDFLNIVVRVLIV